MDIETTISDILKQNDHLREENKLLKKEIKNLKEIYKLTLDLYCPLEEGKE